jgi:hypothetical protein
MSSSQSEEEEIIGGQVVANEDSWWEFLGIINGVASVGNSEGCAPWAASGIAGALVTVGSAASTSKSSIELLSEDGLSGSFTNFLTEGFPFLAFVVTDGSGNIVEDILSVNEEIFSNVVGEGSWGWDDLSHGLKSLPVSSSLGAIGHSCFNSCDEVTNNFKSVDNVGSSTGLEVLDSGCGISENVLKISDASSDIIETLSVDGSLENTDDDLLKLDDICLKGTFGFLLVVWFVVWVMWFVVWVMWFMVFFVISSIVMVSVFSLFLSWCCVWVRLCGLVGSNDGDKCNSSEFHLVILFINYKINELISLYNTTELEKEFNLID